MNVRKLVPLLLTVGAVAAVGVGGVALGFEPVSPVVADLAGAEDPKPPALVAFESAGAQCTDDFRANSSTSVAGGGANTEITYSRNLSLPDPSHAIGGPTFERLNDSAYALRVPTEATQKAPRDCPGVARYEAGVRIPAGDDPWTLFVYHDDERVATLSGESDSSIAGGSVRGGQHVSD